MSAAAMDRSTVPPHVPPERVVDFDFYDDRRYREAGDMHAGIVALVKETPPGIFFTPAHGGHWVITTHRLMLDATRRTEVFSSRRMGLPPMEGEPRQIPINLDPPQHGTYRMPLMKAFAPAAMAALEPRIRRLAGELIDKVVADGRCDFAIAVAEPLPVIVFMEMMGMPLERLAEFRVWVHQMLSDTPERVTAYGNVAELMAGLIAERQERRREDLISRLIDADIDGRPPTFEELQAYCLLLFVAGLDTVANGMSFGIRHLAREPELQARLRAEPGRITAAVEELLRRYTFTVPARIVAQDAEFGGVTLRKDDRVLLLLPAADLDAAAFPRPTEFDLDRENSVHVAFNSGPHRCVGSHLARLELRILYEEWLQRVPPFRQDPDRPERWHGAHVLAVDSLPLVWDR